MGTNIEPGTITESYEMVLPNGESKNLDKGDVLFYSGVLVKNKPYPVSQVFVEDAEEESCSACGILSPCTNVVSRENDYSYETRLCNHCLAHEEKYATHNATIELCQSCTKKECSHNPRNPGNLLLLPPGKGKVVVDL